MSVVDDWSGVVVEATTTVLLKRLLDRHNNMQGMERYEYMQAEVNLIWHHSTQTSWAEGPVALHYCSTFFSALKSSCSLDPGKYTVL